MQLLAYFYIPVSVYLNINVFTYPYIQVSIYPHIQIPGHLAILISVNREYPYTY